MKNERRLLVTKVIHQPNQLLEPGALEIRGIVQQHPRPPLRWTSQHHGQVSAVRGDLSLLKFLGQALKSTNACPCLSGIWGLKPILSQPHFCHARYTGCNTAGLS